MTNEVISKDKTGRNTKEKSSFEKKNKEDANRKNVRDNKNVLKGNGERLDRKRENVINVPGMESQRRGARNKNANREILNKNEKNKEILNKKTRNAVARENTNRDSFNRDALGKNRESKNARTAVAQNPDVKFEFKKPNLKIIPLGGLGEIGKNITIFEYDNEIVLVDCGLEFPEDNMLGVDLVIPDVTYLVKNQEKIKGLVITHGHEDHIGSIPYVLKQVDMPIYATRLTVGLIENKLEEHKLLRKTKLHTVDQGQTVDFGKIQVEFIRSSHSIPDSVMLAIHTPVGTVMHTGDFKIDLTPIDDQIMDFGRIAEIGNRGVLALLSDSTNSERKGYTMSESSVGDVFDKLFLNCTKRIVIATFASNVHRVQQILNCSVKNKRKVAVCGRSMINMIEVARKLGYIQVPDNTFIDIDMIKNYTDDQLTILTTGSQGEAMSALTRMAAGEHKKVEITPNDLVIISATAIPGNEKLVSKVIDKLMQIGAEVVYSALEDIHVSGHACQEEQKLILALVKPKFFLPVHGEYRQLKAHAESAKKMGIPAENIFMLENR